MSKIHFGAAQGDAPEITITANTLTDLGSCDSNRVHVILPTGVSAMTIQDFGTGDASTSVTKRVRWPGGLTLKHLPPHMNMALAGGDRITNPGDVGTYHADEQGNWHEEDYYNKQFVQKFLVSATNTVIMPTGYSRALFQCIGPGTSPGSFGTAAPGAGFTGGYCEKLFTGVTGGGRFSITLDTSAGGGYAAIASGNQPGGFVFPGSTFNAAGAPLQNYVLGGSSGGPASFGGDINDAPIAGTFVAGVRASTPGIVTHLNPITGLVITPPQQILAGIGPQFLTGLPDGGAAIALAIGTGTFAKGPPAVYITWMR